MSSCKRATKARIRSKPKDSAATMNNPINNHSVKMCSCGEMCKNNRGLRIHQEKTKCQTPENKLVAPPQKCFVSLQNVILSSCFTFDDGVYYRTSDNTFIPISNSEKPVAGKKCYKGGEMGGTMGTYPHHFLTETENENEWKLYRILAKPKN